MSEPFGRLRRFLRELKRRNVYKVAVAYVAVAFVVLQGARLLVPALVLPEWFYRVVVALAFLGFPLALVVAWAFEVTPEGMRRTQEAEPTDETKGPEAGNRTAYRVLVGLGLVAAAVAGGWYLTGGGGESPEVNDGTVAVLPFEVSGSGTADWQDGMVTYLTPGLDGAAGLRAIPDRTVFAAWEESRQTDQGASAEEALAVAREIGSQYAVVGSAGGLGSQVRFVVAVYETVSGDRLGQVEVEGPPDSIPALADSLTRRVLGVMLKESGERLPSVDLGRITTRSLPALKSYLAGERHFRAAEYEAAVEDYEAAVEQDSTFALAYARLALSRGWAGERGSLAPLRRAYVLADRLPERERRLVRAQHLRNVRNRAVAAADTLRRLTEAYPDDPSMWYWLGETLIHGTIPGGWPEAEEAFQRAVRLDPGVAPYHHHLVDLAMSWHHDSVLAARRIEAHPSSRVKHWYRALWDLNFGSADRRRDAWTRIDTLPVGAEWWVDFPLQHPTDLGLRDTVLRRVMGRDAINPTEYATARFKTHVFRGQPGQVLTDLRTRDEDLGDDACALADALAVDYPVPDSVARRYLAPENLPDNPSLVRFICAGFYLVESGRSDELDGLIRRLRATVDTAGPEAVSPGRREGAVRELWGYRAWQQGNLERAAQTWNRAYALGPLGPLLRGDLYRQLGELDTAEGWYQEAWVHPVAHERLGRLYEEMDKPEKAAAAYRRFIAAWEDADPELQPRVEAARERLRELTGAESNE